MPGPSGWVAFTFGMGTSPFAPPYRLVGHGMPGSACCNSSGLSCPYKHRSRCENAFTPETMPLLSSWLISASGLDAFTLLLPCYPTCTHVLVSPTWRGGWHAAFTPPHLPIPLEGEKLASRKATKSQVARLLGSSPFGFNHGNLDRPWDVRTIPSPPSD